MSAFSPIAAVHWLGCETSLLAKTGLMHRGKTAYSIISSARSS
jgi:hypothetical protein